MAKILKSDRVKILIKVYNNKMLQTSKIIRNVFSTVTVSKCMRGGKIYRVRLIFHSPAYKLVDTRWRKSRAKIPSQKKVMLNQKSQKTDFFMSSFWPKKVNYYKKTTIWH